MDSDFRRPQRNNNEPVDTHIPHPEDYETASPRAEGVEAAQNTNRPVFQDIKPASSFDEKLPTADEMESPAPLAAPVGPKRNRLMKRRLPQVIGANGQPVAAAEQVASEGGTNPADSDKNQPLSQETPKKSKRKSNVWKWILGILLVLVVLLVVAAFVGYRWYNSSITAIDPNSDEIVRVTVPDGIAARNVGPILDEAGLLRDLNAYNLYYRLNGNNTIKAGVYNFEKNQDVPSIVEKLESGSVDEFTLTFLPGGTIFHAKVVMKEAGYSEQEIDAALYANYDSPIMKDRPAGSSIEGYIYGETYNFFAGSSAQEVFAKTIEHLEDYMVANDLEAKFAAKGFNIHEGLTFASLVQTEVGSADEMKQVSSVFHNRLKIDMELGSDVTFRYAAKLLDEPVAVEIDSPYNTRIYKGLPPGPVAAPGASALEATAAPDETDYLFFVSGDDGVTYFSRTNEEHERLTREHCDANCRVQM